MEVRNSVLAGEGQTVEDTEGETEQERKLEAQQGPDTQREPSREMELYPEAVRSQ